MDDLLEDEVEEDLEILDDGENLEAQNLPVGDQEDLESGNKNDDEEKERKQVKAKRVIKNPRVTLNAERLKGPKGLSVLEGCFEKVKFKGKGREEEDLNVLLKTYEYWCHRLFPKFSFQDTIEKIEKLGSKGPIQTHLKKVRSGMIEDDLPSISGVAADVRSEEDDTEETAAQIATQTLIEDIPIVLTEEQLETIRRNREKAEKLRQERLKKIQEKASLNLPEVNISAPISILSSDNMEENGESPGSSTHRLPETTREASNYTNESLYGNDEDISEHSRKKKTSHLEGSLKVCDDSEDVRGTVVNSDQNREPESYHQISEDSDILDGELKNVAENSISLTREITDDRTVSGSGIEYFPVDNINVHSDQ